MILQQTLAQRVGVGVDLEHARPAHRSQQVQGMHQPERATEIVRAIGSARCEHCLRDRQAAGGCPIWQVGLVAPNRPVDRLLERPAPRMFRRPPAGPARRGELGPLGAGRSAISGSSIQRRLNLRAGHHRLGRGQVPGLIGVDHQPFIGFQVGTTGRSEASRSPR